MPSSRLRKALSNARDATAAAIAGINSLSPKVFYHSGLTPQFFATESGIVAPGEKVTVWKDLSGNNNHGTQTSAPLRPTIATNANGTWVDFDRAASQTINTPFTPLSAVTSFTIVTIWERDLFNTAQGLYGYDNFDLQVRWSGGDLFQFNIGGAGNFANFLEQEPGPNVIQEDFDGSQPNNNTRLIVSYNLAQRPLTFGGTIPAAVPALTLTGLLGSAPTVPLDGRIKTYLVFVPKLTIEQVSRLYSFLAILAPFIGTLVNPDTDLTQSTEVLAIGSAANETAVGHTVTADHTVTVFTDPSPHFAEPMVFQFGTNYRCVFRHALSHGPDPVGQLIYCDSADDGETWGATSVVVDTPGIDDRGAFIYFDSMNNQRICWYMHTGGAFQCYDRLFAGAAGTEINVSGYPLSPTAINMTARPEHYDTGSLKWVLYGEPIDLSRLSRVGLVDRTALTLHWLDNDTWHLFEPTIIRVDASTLLVFVRTGTPGAVEVRGPMMYAKSTNNGATWSDWHEFSFFGDAPFFFKSPTTGIVYCAFREHDGANRYTTVVWTNDGGDTWSDKAAGRIYTHITTDCSYPGIAQRSDGKLIVVHYEPRFIRATICNVT